MVKDFQVEDILTCTRCKRPVSTSKYHYGCRECNHISGKACTCRECYKSSNICRTHNIGLHKQEYKRWPAVYRWIDYIDRDITERDDDLIQALKENDTVKIRQFTQDSQLLNARGYLDYTPLHVAAYLGLEEGAQILLEHGAIRETRNSDNDTPLAVATETNHPRIAKLLLDHGANVEVGCGARMSRALHIAAADGMWHMVALFLRHGATVDAPSGRGTALQLSAWVGSDRCAELLLAAGANPDAKSEDAPSTALCRGAFGGHSMVVTLLLDYGARVNTTNYTGWTALMYAAQEGHLDICKSLLDRHAGMDLQTDDGWNALSLAAYHGREDIVVLLIERGASGTPPRGVSGKWKNLPFKDHVTPLAKARMLGMLRAAKHA